MNPPNCAQCAQRVVALNKAIVDWASVHNSTESPITVVDCWTGFDDAKDTNDGVHPNGSGNQKMADAWFDPLVWVLQA
jgi:lysophospholipase L1-like esterase